MLIGLLLLSGFTWTLYNDGLNKNLALTKITGELEEVKSQLVDLAPLSELAGVSETPTTYSSGTGIFPGYQMSFRWWRGGAYGLYDEYDDTYSVMVFYNPMDGAVAHMDLIVDPVDRYELNLCLQKGNAWRNETWVKQNVTYPEGGSSLGWGSPIVWSLKTMINGVYESIPLSKGWYTLSMFGPIIHGNESGQYVSYPRFMAVYPWYEGVQIDSYKAFVAFAVLKNREISLIAVTNDHS
jgi:hypothetical protein